MLNKHEQTINVIDQLSLKKNEGCHMRQRGLNGRHLPCSRFGRDHFYVAATVANSQRQWQAGRTGEIVNIVSQVDGFAVDNSPRRLEAMVNALAAFNVWRKDGNRITDEMFFGFAWPSTGGFSSRLLVGVFVSRFVGVEQFVAFETVIFREDRLFRRLDVDLGCQQCLQSLDSLLELFVFFSELLVLLGDRSNKFRQLGDPIRLLSYRLILRIDLWWCNVRHDERVTNPSILRNPNRKWAATSASPNPNHEAFE